MFPASLRRLCCVGVCVQFRFSFLMAFGLAAWLLVTVTAALADANDTANATSYRIAVAPPGEAPVTLYVEERGKGPPLVLLHGLGGSGYSFRYIVPALARTHRVITLDLKGFGASDKPLDANYHANDQARLVVAFLRQRRLQQVVLAGHSFGGVVALLTAFEVNRTEPTRIKRLVLMNAPAFPQRVPSRQWFLTLPIVPYVALAVVPPILTAREALATVRRMTPPATDREAIAYAEPLYETGGRHALIATTRGMVDMDPRHVVVGYPSIRQPTLVLWCRHDPTVPLTTGERLTQVLPRARLHVLEHCDHAPAEEQPLETADALVHFLARQR